ncbi:MAG: hypothetical protein A3H97_12570 [Acidobacteria bacterium RIFCSPLOWO2_02_FULL_65_29]|nr:MAG: hypothetical protein A3H97_12570 [Acidobacteria bacterium RIFCSPLOWO2_02_FULL_65_29]
MTTRTTLTMVAVGAVSLLVLLVAPVLAHHNLIAQFSTNKPVSLRGTLTKMEWTNPHAWIHVSVKGEDGRAEEWAIETGSPLAMQRRGLKRTDFKPGIEIIVGGFAARDGSRTAAGMIVTFPDREVTSPGAETSFTLGR